MMLKDALARILMFPIGDAQLKDSLRLPYALSFSSFYNQQMSYVIKIYYVPANCILRSTSVIFSLYRMKTLCDFRYKKKAPRTKLSKTVGRNQTANDHGNIKTGTVNSNKN